MQLLPILTILILGSTFACKNSIKNDLKTQPIADASLSQSLIDSNDLDNYFTESTKVQSTSGPNSITRSALQDHRENLWLATWLGIIEYDGKTFINHTNKEGLRRYRIFDILEDRNNTLWFASIGAGIYKYDRQTFKNIDSDDGLINNSVQCLYEDSNGEIWIGTQNGISRYRKGLFENLSIEDGTIDNDINSIIESEDGIYWIGARGEARIFNGSTFERIRKPDGEPFTNVRCIIRDRSHNMWLAGNDGLWKYDGKSFAQIYNDFVGYVYEDGKENIWTSSVQGGMNNWILSCYNKDDLGNPQVYLPKTNMLFLPKANMLFDIIEDNQENIWVGSLDGVMRFDGEKFEYFN